MTNMPVDFWVLIAIVAAALGAIGLVRHGLLKRAARNWPQVSATVEITYVIGGDSDRYGGSSFWIPVLGYSYVINGDRYSGSVGLEGSSSNDEYAAEEAGKAWRGQKILVRFDPQKPEKSAFLPEDGAPPATISYADQPPDSAGLFSFFK
jgi:hypothetical protein